MNKKKIHRIIWAITIFLIVFLSFSIYNSIKGNPISAKIANSKIKAYVNNTYSGLDLTVSKTRYSFKDSSYNSLVQSKTSQDTVFMVSYTRGKVTDYYDYEVANHITTYRRLTDSFQKEIETILSREFPYTSSILIAAYGKEDSDIDKLTLDMPFDLNDPPMPASLTVYSISEEQTYEILSERLVELKTIMDQHRIPISTYSLVLEPSDEKNKPAESRLYLFDFPTEKIDSKDLISEIKNHQTAREQEGQK